MPIHRPREVSKGLRNMILMLYIRRGLLSHQIWDQASAYSIFWNNARDGIFHFHLFRVIWFTFKWESEVIFLLQHSRWFPPRRHTVHAAILATHKCTQIIILQTCIGWATYLHATQSNKNLLVNQCAMYNCATHRNSSGIFHTNVPFQQWAASAGFIYRFNYHQPVHQGCWATVSLHCNCCMHINIARRPQYSKASWPLDTQ